LVLVAGGETESNGVSEILLASSELYNPVAGTWAYTGSMNYAREQHTETLLPTGLVLVAGGQTDFGVGAGDASAELYNPAAGTWVNTGSLNTGRYFDTATLMPNGIVLIAAGDYSEASGDLAGAELFFP
jgi:hypothetical protein